MTFSLSPKLVPFPSVPEKMSGPSPSLSSPVFTLPSSRSSPLSSRKDFGVITTSMVKPNAGVRIASPVQANK